ncbi:MAG TPA: acetyl-CoA carboxylase biotin carboxyl carrier protein [Terriglobia bacterium]
MPEKNRPGAETSERDWRLKDIEKLMDLLAEREISEFEMEKNGFRIRIRRGENQAAAPASALVSAVVPAPLPVTSAPAGPPPAPDPAPVSPAPLSAAEAAPSESTDGLYIIKSPIVGTFYRSSSPNSEAFVQMGDAVRVGQVLCIIEAMKLMNEIQSEVNGEVVRIYAESGQPVEYGQSLFAIKPSHQK